uniref:Uncharacterized protein n=1 Tax=Arundo donax TaxID=35708 RepID=A0A0A9E675_ARUDO
MEQAGGRRDERGWVLVGRAMGIAGFYIRVQWREVRVTCRKGLALPRWALGAGRWGGGGDLKQSQGGPRRWLVAVGRAGGEGGREK